MDDVERGDVELDLPVDREHEMRQSRTPPYGRVAVGELPLLGDHLHLQRRLAFRRGRSRAAGTNTGFEPLAAAGAAEELVRAEAGEERAR